jgi:hypothetical protein
MWQVGAVNLCKFLKTELTDFRIYDPKIYKKSTGLGG